ncbi:MAG: DNA repair exonuclease [Deltaproteobacteria bacterium]|nr:DNA repair exonuclease [Deltaproteobacteria bacterium]
MPRRVPVCLVGRLPGFRPGVRGVTGSVAVVAYNAPARARAGPEPGRFRVDPVGESFPENASLFRFLHAADIHLDSPLQGLERYPDAPVDAVRGAPRRAFEALIDLAIEERVAFVLLAGDLYDGDWKDYNTGLFFVGQMRRLAEAGIAVHLVSGNHDAASQITKRLSLPPNVHHYATRRPETIELPDFDVAIHGQSFAARRVSEDLAAAYPMADPGRVEIGLLHTSLDGRPGHADYAPCTAEGLRAKGYAYWALGHVHQREVVSRDPWIVFPGNLQGRHARETGGKGASLVTVDHGRVVDVDHRDLDVVRWARIELDLESVGHPDDALARVRDALAAALVEADGRLLAARVVLGGATRAHAALVREPARWLHECRLLATGMAEPGIWLERLELATRPRGELGRLLERDDALGGLLRRVEALERAPLDLARTREELADLKRRLPAALIGEAGSGAEEDGRAERFDPTDPAWLRARLPAVRDLLWSRLLDGEASE